MAAISGKKIRSFLYTDPEFIERFDNFAFDEVVNSDDMDGRTRMMAILASLIGCQLLICTAGESWYQEEGKEAVSLAPGSIIVIPANVKHWHGAKKDSWFSHIACEIPGEDCSTEWCEAVTDEEYHQL